MNYFIDNYGINKSYQTNYNIPEIPNHLTIKMVRYLVKKPHLIYTWFLSNKHIILVPLYYEMFCDTINDLYEILNEGYKHLEDDENNSIDSFDLYQVILPMYCQNTLLTNLINQVKLVELSDDCLTILCDAFEKISSKEFALLIILDLIYQYISEVYSNDFLFESNLSSKIIIRIIKILNKISDKKGFNENFFDMCGNILINIILSPNWRNDVSILNEFSEFLINLNEDIKLPIQITQLLLFLITSKDDKAISNATKLCNRFNENEISNPKRNGSRTLC